MVRLNGFSSTPETVAELGPGDSIGIGLAVLLSGSEKYYACDVVEYANPTKNLEVLEELINLFQAREDIPGEDEFPRVIPRLDSYEFPADILGDDRLQIAQDESRIAPIRWSVENMTKEGSVLRYIAPWHGLGVLQPGSVDMVYSQSILEHVEDYSYL